MLAGASRNALKRSARIGTHSACPPASVCVQRHASTAPAPAPNKWARPGRQESGRLRSQPWQFERDPSFRGDNGSTPLSRYNLELLRHANQNNTHAALELVVKMKQEGVPPDQATYNQLLRVLSQNMMYPEAWAVVEDMRSMQIPPNRSTCHHLLHAARKHGLDEQLRIFDFMDEQGIDKNEHTYSHFIIVCAHMGRLELALQTFYDMQARGFQPLFNAAERLIQAAAESDQPRLAVELAEHFEATSIRRLEVRSWVDCLSASAEALYAEGVERCWEKVVRGFGVNPDEGLCMAVLHTAARHGLPTLANEALEVLVALQVPLQEYHFAPVVEACARHGSLKAAMGTLGIMRSIGIVPGTTTTARPIYDHINESADRVDEAYALLEEIRADGQPVDVVAFNTVLWAARKLRDLQRAVGTYKAAADLGVAPDVESYNYLFSCCIDAQHRELGDKLLAEMKAAGVAPNEATYTRFILLCLKPRNYEDAFFYLEEMKTAGFKPPKFVYENIIRKCVGNNDTRHNIAVEEMVECGYELNQRLQEFIDSGGRIDRPERVIEEDKEHNAARAVAEMRNIFLEEDTRPPSGHPASTPP